MSPESFDLSIPSSRFYSFIDSKPNSFEYDGSRPSDDSSQYRRMKIARQIQQKLRHTSKKPHNTRQCKSKKLSKYDTSSKLCAADLPSKKFKEKSFQPVMSSYDEISFQQADFDHMSYINQSHTN